MNCPNDSDLLHSVLDGEVDGQTASEYREHLAACGECRQRHEFHDRLRGMLRTQVTRQETPSPIRQRLLERLAQEKAPAPAPVVPLPTRPAQPARAWWTRGVLAAASFGLMSTAALYQLTPRSAPLANTLAAHHCACCGNPHDGPCPDPTPIAQATFGSAPEVARFPALNPYDVKVCSLNQGGNALHVVYHNSNSQVVSMFGMPESQGSSLQLPEANDDSIQPHMMTAQDQTVAAWKRRGWVYSLVSRMPPDQLQTLASQGRYGGVVRQPWAVPVPGNTLLPVGGPPAQPVFHQ